MKYCQYCGAELPDGDFSFCAVCGNPLREDHPVQKKQGQKKVGTHRKKKKTWEQRNRPKNRLSRPKSEDDEYDGYYDDVLPDDDGKVSQGMDRQTVKKIIGLIAGVLLAIFACVALMYML